MAMAAAIATVLVVDDDKLVRQTARIILEQSGYAVREADDGEAALKSLAENRTDIVLLDILMPRKEGLETLIELKRMFPDVIVYAISASGRNKGHDFLAVAAKFGADGTLQKPFSPRDLLALVRSPPKPRVGAATNASAAK
jgi:DNA-binding response OmpR family regulator